MRDQRFALVRTANEKLHDIGRDPCAMKATEQEFAGRRRFLTRFEDHRVTGDQCRNDMSVRQVSREVERAENCHHAVRLVANRGRSL